MRLLILGGTQFVGRHLVEAARQRGHSLTLFNRGRTNPNLFPDVEELHGDRDEGLSALGGRTWDAVIDTTGYLPRIVRESAETLSGRVGHYLFVSSISVYKSPIPDGADENAPLDTMDDEKNEDIRPHYGALKVLCEREIDARFDGSTLHVRPGIIVGPHDPTDRFTYWVHRVAQGGEVLAPGHPDRQIQFIDGRDLAAFMLDQTEAGATGAVNATGPDTRVTMRDYLEGCIQVTGSNARLAWVSDDFLLEHNAGVFTELPYWLPESHNSLFTVSNALAVSRGLTFRPLHETLRDIWTWNQTRPPESARWSSAFAGTPRALGMTPERENALLTAWRERTTAG